MHAPAALCFVSHRFVFAKKRCSCDSSRHITHKQTAKESSQKQSGRSTAQSFANSQYTSLVLSLTHNLLQSSRESEAPNQAWARKELRLSTTPSTHLEPRCNTLNGGDHLVQENWSYLTKSVSTRVRHADLCIHHMSRITKARRACSTALPPMTGFSLARRSFDAPTLPHASTHRQHQKRRNYVQARWPTRHRSDQTPASSALAVTAFRAKQDPISRIPIRQCPTQ